MVDICSLKSDFNRYSWISRIRCAYQYLQPKVTLWPPRLEQRGDQDRVFHPAVGHPLHDERHEAGGQDHAQGLQAAVRQTRLLQIPLQNNGQGIRHGEGGGEIDGPAPYTVIYPLCQADNGQLSFFNASFLASDCWRRQDSSWSGGENCGLGGRRVKNVSPCHNVCWTALPICDKIV